MPKYSTPFNPLSKPSHVIFPLLNGDTPVALLNVPTWIVTVLGEEGTRKELIELNLCFKAAGIPVTRERLLFGLEDHAENMTTHRY